MSRISVKLLSIIAIMIFLLIIPIVVLASNEDVSIILQYNETSKEEYIIYVKKLYRQTVQICICNKRKSRRNGFNLY